MMQTSFVHLRVSSEFSISRGLLRINEIIENAQKLKMPAVALTDLNSMFGMVKFFKKAEAAGFGNGVPYTIIKVETPIKLVPDKPRIDPISGKEIDPQTGKLT